MLEKFIIKKLEAICRNEDLQINLEVAQLRLNNIVFSLENNGSEEQKDTQSNDLWKDASQNHIDELERILEQEISRRKQSQEINQEDSLLLEQQDSGSFPTTPTSQTTARNAQPAAPSKAQPIFIGEARDRKASRSLEPSLSDANANQSKKEDQEGEEKAPALTSSMQVMSDFTEREGRIIFQSKGRPNSILGSSIGQGDHVTAYALIKYGIGRPLNGMSLETVGDLNHLRKDRREKVYNFVSAVGSIVEEEQRDAFYGGIDEVINQYNRDRHSKGNLRSMQEVLSSDNSRDIRIATYREKSSDTQDISDDEIDRQVKQAYETEIQKSYQSNGRLMCESFSKISNLSLTCYSGTSDTTFHKITNYKAPPSEGAEVDSALHRLEDLSGLINGDKLLASFLQEEQKRLTDKIRRERGKSDTNQDLINQLQQRKEEINASRSNADYINQFDSSNQTKESRLAMLQGQEFTLNITNIISDHLTKLFHYPAIDQTTLDNHQGAMETLGMVDKARDNDSEKFQDLVSKHLFLSFEIFGELEDFKRPIVEQFLVKIKSQEMGPADRQYSWNDIPEIVDISAEAIIGKINGFKQQKEATGYKVPSSARSSESEEEQLRKQTQKDNIDKILNFVAREEVLEEDEEIAALREALGDIEIGDVESAGEKRGYKDRLMEGLEAYVFDNNLVFEEENLQSFKQEFTQEESQARGSR